MKFLSVFFIFLGLLSLVFNISHPFGLSGKSIQYYNNFEDRLFFGCVQLLVGIILFYIGYKRQEDKEKISKCPTCKEIFNHHELENGKCPYCKDVDMVDIEEYYKQYPKERDDK
ncbi:hypothetical protein [Arcobacter sp. FWKO B]|uniref:hypothetical protein n=1 Tax=Arcobacter sp. FWKO B TaxID=2593672 RepID=UPI0018A358F1|nr:hypothetical protein [Arcobacter sp. FWKO B]QOG12452.1 hypothetical protein FWKOB_06945 [Arcobacter sp. FWKO B]